MKDPWEKAYVYGHDGYGGTVAHIMDVVFGIGETPLCGSWINRLNHTAKPYPVCKNCLKTKRSKELGL
jgi:hypothetical protein